MKFYANLSINHRKCFSLYLTFSEFEITTTTQEIDHFKTI